MAITSEAGADSGDHDGPRRKNGLTHISSLTEYPGRSTLYLGEARHARVIDFDFQSFAVS
jgi:hypothetical protein